MRQIAGIGSPQRLSFFPRLPSSSLPHGLGVGSPPSLSFFPRLPSSSLPRIRGLGVSSPPNLQHDLAGGAYRTHRTYGTNVNIVTSNPSPPPPPPPHTHTHTRARQKFCSVDSSIATSDVTYMYHNDLS